jgi:hypothetical protein
MDLGSIARRLHQWVSTSTPGTAPRDEVRLTDNELKAKIAENAEYTANLIALETARSTQVRKTMREIGFIALMVLTVAVVGIWVVVHAAAGMKLPVSGVIASSVVGGSGVGGLALWGGRRLLGGRQAATAESSPDDQPEEGSRDRAGAP